jgi:pyruvate dehydrogenase E2 component (dihydrolipoamide acetyltransferase)
MPVEVVLPRVDMGMESGSIGAWKIADGENVREGQILFEINTDKAVMEIDSPAAGRVRVLCPEVGTTIAVGTVVALVYAEGETMAPLAAPKEPQPPAAVPPANSERPVSAPLAVPAGEPQGKARATPMARRLAREAGLALADIAGSGPRGRITRADVEAAAGARKAATHVQAAPSRVGDGRLEPFDNVRRIIARRLSDSMRNAPHFFLNAHLDMTACNDLRKRVAPRIEERTGVRVSLTMLLLRIVAPMLVRHPLLNASAEGEAIRYHDRVDIGIAMERDGSLVVPVLRDVQAKSLEEIARDFARLTASVRDRTIPPSELTGSTFTISNLGMFGVDSFTAIINPPEAAILAIGRTVDTPVGRDGRIELRPIANFCLSSDHRIVDGVAAARFMASLREAVETPEVLL